MDSKLFRTAILVSLFVLVGLLCLQVLAGGIGLSGPAQDFSIQQGETMSSHLTIWNEGEEVENFRAWVTGEVTSFLSVLPGNFSLAPGGSRVITLTYLVPTGQPTGTYDGYVSISPSRQGILPTASRAVTIAVTSSSSGQIILRNGLNLVSWLGPSGSIESVVPAGQGLFKIWERKSDGSYVSTQFYAESGVWWSSDAAFTGLGTGKAYFFESTQDCVLQIQEGLPPSSIHLDPGLNFIGWPYDSRSFDEAFQQNPSDYAVVKVWKRLSSGDYSFAQYYPEQDEWWSSDTAFTALEKGCGYFVEALQELDVSS